MLLADIDIRKALQKNKIIIKPLPNFDEALSACALDLRLGYQFQKITKKINLKKGEPFILEPGEFVLASTFEWIGLPSNIAGRLEGRSSLGRLGIVVHSTASLIHPGFQGHLVLELGNHSSMPVSLYPEMRVCSLSFEQLTQPAERPYYKQKGAKYVNQKGVVSSKIEEEIS